MISRILITALLSVVAVLAVALGLVASQSPRELEQAGGLDFSEQIAGGIDAAAPLRPVTMRDGYALQVRRYDSARADAPLLVLVHGSGWHGLQFDRLARELSAVADVVVPDLRGHGAAPGRRGDIDYIGQYEDDLADLITAEARAGQPVVMGGHSSGGGLVVRFAGGASGDMISGAVLLAPFLQHDAPMTRANSGGWAFPLTRRIIGLSILNTFRMTALNGLPIIQFNMPQAVLDGPLGDTATLSYSYRLNTSYAPRRDYLTDVAALPPFLLLAGSRDEAFDATLYAPTMVAATDKGTYLTLNGATHLGIVDDIRTRAEITEFLNEF